MILMCGLALDVGLLQLKSIQMQSAADSAVIAAEQEAERGTGNWVAEGQDDAAINGFTNGSNGTTVTASQQPTSGPYSGRYDVLQVTIAQSVHTVMMGALNHGVASISSQAQAVLTPCVYLLGTGTLQTWSLEVYSGDVDGNTCPIDVNTAMMVNGDANMAVEATNVTGAAALSLNVGSVYPTPNFNAQSFSDPLSWVTSPSFSGTCNHTSYSLTGGTATLSPGTYCKGMTLTNSTVTLSPGLYVITGGANWSGSTVTGNGVTLFFTTGGGGGYGQFKIQNSSTVTLSAPTSSTNGGVPSILVFADRNWTTTGGQDFQLSSSTVQGDGIWYLKNAGLYLSSCGNFQGTNYLGIVANNIFTAGTNVHPTNNYSNLATGNPFRKQSVLVQ